MSLEGLVHQRAEVWPGQTPSNSNGSVRPTLKPHTIRYLTAHYTGAGNWDDHDDTPVEIRQIQNYAKGAKKPWEYNYVIDSQGAIWEYAGLYAAAHSRGENYTSIGVLFLLGVNEPCTNPMVTSFRRLREALQTEHQMFAWGHAILPHFQMPGAATACPGLHVMNRWGELTTPWGGPPPPPPPNAWPVFDAHKGLWGLWPLNKSKPTLEKGRVDTFDERQATTYLQGVIAHKAGGRIAIDGDYGPQTKGRVIDLQRYFKKPGHGVTDKTTWDIIDFLASR